MTARHPFERLPDAAISPLLATATALGLCAGLGVALAVRAGPGWEPFARLVLAGDVAGCEAVLAAWSAADRSRIAFVAGLDLLFGLAWANAFALACVGLSRTAPRSWARAAGAAGAWIAWAAMALDLPENVAYLALVVGPVEPPWPWIARAAALARVGLFASATACVVALAVAVRGDGPRRR